MKVGSAPGGRAGLSKSKGDEVAESERTGAMNSRRAGASSGGDHFFKERTCATSAFISSSLSLLAKGFILSLPFLSFIPSLI